MTFNDIFYKYRYWELKKNNLYLYVETYHLQLKFIFHGKQKNIKEKHQLCV